MKINIRTRKQLEIDPLDLHIGDTIQVNYSYLPVYYLYTKGIRHQGPYTCVEYTNVSYQLQEPLIGTIREFKVGKGTANFVILELGYTLQYVLCIGSSLQNPEYNDTNLIALPFNKECRKYYMSKIVWR